LTKVSEQGELQKLTLEDLELEGRRLLIRVDYNVPLNEKGQVTDDSRILATLPTLRYARKKGAKIILVSHLGRPKGKVVDALRMKPVAERLGQILETSIQTVKDCIGNQIEQASQALKPGEILLLENVRFHAEEEKNDSAFSEALSKLADLYVNDAFGTAHRAHASTVGVTQFLPSAMGFLLATEIQALSKISSKPEKPFAIILGGAKVSDKVGILENLIDKLDLILVGGAMAYTFLKVQGVSIGKSKVEEDKLEVAEKILKRVEGKVTLKLPEDHVTANVPLSESPTKSEIHPLQIPKDAYGYDIGPQTVTSFKKALKSARTVLWNGPVGVCENPLFAKGTQEIATFLGGQQDITTVIGGGDTAAAIKQFGLTEKMTHVSTGGGASLEFLEGQSLPGILALTDKKNA